MTCLYIGKETLKKYCERNGLKYQTMWERVDGGLTPEEAVKITVMPKCNTKYFINGKSAYSQMSNSEYQRYRNKVRSEQ